jgi:alpha-1,6-mannosyltransferase
LLVAAFAAGPVLLSHDVYSYVDYARLGVVHGLDPYVHPPWAAPTDPVFASVDWKDTPSVYGPLFTLLTYPLAWLPVGAAVAALKLAAGLSVLGLAALVSRLAAWRGLDPLRAAAFVALNPLVLVHVIGGAHNDSLAVLLAIGGVVAVLAARELSGGAAIVAAIATKASAAFVAPFALLAVARPSSSGVDAGPEDKRPLVRLLAGAALGTLVIAVAAYVAFGWDWLHGFELAGENSGRNSHLSIPSTAARILGLDSGAVRIVALVLYAGFVAYLLVTTWRGRDWVWAAAWAGAGLLLATSWLLPWYLIWALPLVAISRDRYLQLLILALTAFQLGARVPI